MIHIISSAFGETRTNIFIAVTNEISMRNPYGALGGACPARPGRQTSPGASIGPFLLLVSGVCSG